VRAVPVLAGPGAAVVWVGSGPGDDVGGCAVLAQTTPGGVADPAGTGERAEHDLADQFRFDPEDPGDLRSGRCDRERMRSSLQRVEEGLQVRTVGFSEPGAFTGLRGAHSSAPASGFDRCRRGEAAFGAVRGHSDCRTGTGVAMAAMASSA
jgi:hypothetical protein